MGGCTPAWGQRVRILRIPPRLSNAGVYLTRQQTRAVEMETALPKKEPVKVSEVIPLPRREIPLEDERVVEGIIVDDGWFAPLEDLREDTNTLLYGREGSGKTTSAARLVNSRPTGQVLVINAEGGLKLKALRKRGVDTSRIRVWPDPAKHERPTHQALDKIHRQVKADLLRDPDSWIGVVIDSATEVYQAILDSAQESRVQSIVNKGKGDEIDPHHVDVADYGKMTKMVRDLLRKFRDLPCHVVFTALERRDVDKDTGKPQYGPAITPGLQTDILGHPDFVLMCKAEDEDGPFRALTRSNSRYRAKDRFDVLPRVMAEPTMDRVLAYLNEDLTEETDSYQEGLPVKAKRAQDRIEAKSDDDEDDDSDDADES